MAGEVRFPYQCAVINLDRQPERLAEFRQWNEGCGLEIERFQAVDGRLVDEATRRSVNPYGTPSPASIGCQLSHKLLWERVARTGRPLVIFEDDAVLRADIASVLPSVVAQVRGLWEIILLGYNTDSVLKVRTDGAPAPALSFPRYPAHADLVALRDSRVPIAPFRLVYAFGMCAYILSPVGAAKLLKQCFPVVPRMILPSGLGGRRIRTQTLDMMLNTLYATIEAYICLPPLALSPNLKAPPGS